MDTGRFVTSVLGVAFEAAATLCASAACSLVEGGILVSDAVAVAISRTHCLSFAADGYHLAGTVQLPNNMTFDALYGKGAIEEEPTAPGPNTSWCFPTSIQQGQHSLTTISMAKARAQTEAGACMTGPAVTHSTHTIPRRSTVQNLHFVDAPASLSLDGVLALSRCTTETAASNQGDSPCSKHHLSGMPHEQPDVQQRPLEWSISKAPQDSSTPAVSAVSKVRRKVAKASSADFRLGVSYRTHMEVREQLRSEMRALVPGSYPDPRDLHRIPHSVFLPTKQSSPQPATNEFPTADYLANARGAAAATAHLHWSGQGRRSTNELMSGLSPGSAAGSPSPHLALIPSITPFGPGTGPLASLPARQRAADVLFAGASSSVFLTSLVQPIRQDSPPANGSGITNIPASGTTFPDGQLARDALGAVFSAMGSQARSSSPAGLRMGSTTGAAAALAAANMAVRPSSPTRTTSPGPTLRLSSPALHSTSSPYNGPCSSPSAGRACSPATGRGGQPSRASLGSPPMIASNHGMVPLYLLQQQLTARLAGAHGCSPQPVSLTPLPAGSARRSTHLSETSTRSTPEWPQLSRASAAKSKQIDDAGVSPATIHRQAVATWKDLGSQSAAGEYVSHLPRGVVNASFSTAGLAQLPDLSRLAHLETLAASFNHITSLTSGWLQGCGRRLQMLDVSHSSLSALPEDFGDLLPSLTQLSLAHCALSELPDSLCTLPELRCLSVSHNQLSAFPAIIWQLYSLEQLHAGFNELTELPDCLASFPALTVLSVPGNQLKALPPSLTCLGGSLLCLDCSHNALACLPPNFLTAMTRLQELKLHHNHLCMCHQIHGLMAVGSHYDESQAHSTSFGGSPEARSPISTAARLASTRIHGSRHASRAVSNAASRHGSRPTSRTTSRPRSRPGGDSSLIPMNSEAPLQPVLHHSTSPISVMAPTNKPLSGILRSTDGSTSPTPAQLGRRSILLRVEVLRDSDEFAAIGRPPHSASAHRVGFDKARVGSDDAPGQADEVESEVDGEESQAGPVLSEEEAVQIAGGTDEEGGSTASDATAGPYLEIMGDQPRNTTEATPDTAESASKADAATAKDEALINFTSVDQAEVTIKIVASLHAAPPSASPADGTLAHSLALPPDLPLALSLVPPEFGILTLPLDPSQPTTKQQQGEGCEAIGTEGGTRCPPSEALAELATLAVPPPPEGDESSSAPGDELTFTSGDELRSASNREGKPRSGFPRPKLRMMLTEPILPTESSTMGVGEKEAVDTALATGEPLQVPHDQTPPSVRWLVLAQHVQEMQNGGPPMLPCLRLLDLSANQLSGMPTWLPPSLGYLNMSKNKIAILPNWVCLRLTKLGSLALHSNAIYQLPRDLLKLPLHLLSLEDNPMQDPEEMAGVLNGAFAVMAATEALRAAKYQTKKHKAIGDASSSPTQGSSSSRP